MRLLAALNPEREGKLINPNPLKFYIFIFLGFYFQLYFIVAGFTEVDSSQAV